MGFISGGRIESATGGTISTIGGHKVHTFDTVGLNVFTPSTNGVIEVLVVGGGSAGSAQTGGSGGGGGGSVLYQKLIKVSAGVAYTMNIGAGGTNGNAGTSSVINLPTGTVNAFSGDVGIGSFGKFVFSSVPSSINEGSSGTFNVTTDKFPNGTTVFWTINHITTVDADFGSISGSFVVNNDAGSFSVPIVNDELVEGSETFTVSIRTNSPSGTILITSPVVTISPATVTSGLVMNLDAGNITSYPTTGTTWTDLSGSSNTGTLTNGPTYSSANSGSIVFDGTDDKVDCGNSATLQITQGTISAWIKADSGNLSYNGIITKQFAWSLFVLDNVLISYDWGNSTNRSTGITIGNGTWNHVAMTFAETVGTPSNNAIIYLNGSPVLTTTVKHVNQTAPVQIGDGNNTSQNFGGNIAQVSIYNRVLNAAEILQNYNALKGRFGL